MELMVTPGVLNNSEKLDYAFGLTVSDYKGLKMVSHSGGCRLPGGDDSIS